MISTLLALSTAGRRATDSFTGGADGRPIDYLRHRFLVADAIQVLIRAGGVPGREHAPIMRG